MEDDSRGGRAPRGRWRQGLRWASIALVATACARFSGVETPPEPLDASTARDGAFPDALPPTDGPTPEETAPPPQLCPGSAHTFCDGFDGNDVLDRRWMSIVGAEHFSFSTRNVVSPPKALRVAGQRVSPNALARAEARLPLPSRSIRCEAQLRLEAAPSEGALPLALRFEAGSEHLLILLILFPGAFELGAERGTSDGGTRYEYTYQQRSIPQISAVTKTTLDVSLLEGKVRLAFAEALIATLPIDVPIGITTTTFAIGDLRVNGTTGVTVDTFIDDVFCDVDRP